MDIGAPSWASGSTAAALYGFDGFLLRPPFHITLPRDRQVRRVNAVVHSSESIDRLDTAIRAGVPMLSATRTLIDLGRTEPPDRLTAALDSAVRDGLTSEDFLHKRITELRSSGRYGIPKLLDVIGGLELSRGGHSWLERRFLELVGGAGLPRPRTQQVLTRANDRVVRVDCWFDDTPIVVEVLGYRWHRTEAQMRRDAERRNALHLAKYTVYEFTYRQLACDPDAIVATLRRALMPYVGPPPAARRVT